MRAHGQGSPRRRARIAVGLLIAAAIAAFFIFHLDRYVSLEYFQSRRDQLLATFHASPFATAGVFFAVYVAVTGLSLPGAGIMSLAAGAIFGLVWGTLIVSFASSLGATIAFLASRFVLRDWVQARFGERLKAVNEGIARDGAFYLFAMRLVPAFPFFVINLAMGLTPMPVRTFYGVSQAGMFPGTIAFVYAGVQLAQLRFSPGLLLAFVALAMLPFAGRGVLAAIRERRLYARWKRPARFERNLVVIGGGSAGLVAAYIAATVRARVTLVEREAMGGDCLNTGCVPSKALIRTTRLLAAMRRAPELGIHAVQARADFAAAMERVQRVIAQVAPHDSVERYAKLGVECLRGTARLVSPWQVAVTLEGGGERTIATRAIVIAAGARPLVPDIPGLARSDPLTSETVWSLRELPQRLVVLGGGPIGCELAQCFARLGSEVTLLEAQPRLLAREDPEFSALVAERFRAEGIRVLTGHEVKEVRVEAVGSIVVASHEGGEVQVACERILCALGRVARTEGYGLEALGIPTTAKGTIEVDEYLATRYPNIYACGDVAGPYQFTHAASHMAWYASVNALFGRFRRFRVDWSVLPWVTFTEPEVARVGLNESEAREKGIEHEVITYDLADLDRAIADGEAHGLVKVLTRPGSDRILGATVAGENAGEVVAELVLAMRHGVGLSGILGTIHAYPTLAEANKYAAGAWRRSRVTRGQLAFAERFHEWMRGAAGLGAVLGAVGRLRDRRRAEPKDAGPE